MKLLLGLCLITLLGFGLARLRLDVDFLNLLPAETPSVRGLKLYQDNYSTARELIITVSTLKDAEAAESTARSIAELIRNETNLVRQVTWQPPWLEHPSESAKLIAYLWLNSPPEEFAKLTRRLSPEKLPALLDATSAKLATSMSPGELVRASNDPFGLTDVPQSERNAAFSADQGRNMFESEDGTFRIIFVEASKDLANYRQASAWLNQVKATIAEWQEKAESSDVQIGYTGGPAFMAEISKSMESTIRNSVIGTLLVIGAMFWLAHRRFRPLLWLVALLALVLLGTLAAGGLIFGTINVVSMGFAAMLLGLAADYGLVLYQEAQAAPGKSPAAIRRELAPGIAWSAVTTAGAFALLSFSGLPGLAQLGWLVAIGMSLAATILLFAYLPPLSGKSRSCLRETNLNPRPSRMPAFSLVATMALLFAAIAILRTGLPTFDKSPAALRPRHIQAYDTYDSLKSQFGQFADPLWLLVAGTNESEVAQQLEQCDTLLRSEVSNHFLNSYSLPIALWPNPDHQTANRATARRLVEQREQFYDTAATHGFKTNSLALTDSILATWERACSDVAVFHPTNSASRWIFDKFMTRSPEGWIALGTIIPEAELFTSSSHLSTFKSQLPSHVYLSGWNLMGEDIANMAQRDFSHVLWLMLVLLLLSLWLAFRRIGSVFLSLAALAYSIAILLALMELAGWQWNLMNMTALPLLLGAGIDYGIHMQLGLRRHGGDIAATRRTVGRALLLCAGTTIAGFGSLAWSTNTGLATLGKICAAGIACNYLVAVHLLPAWWRLTTKPVIAQTSNNPPSPSALYSTALWSLAHAVTRCLPERWLRRLMSLLASSYWNLARRRRNIVIANCQYVLEGDNAAAERCGRKLIQNFAHKLVDLWRYEIGLPTRKLIGQPEHWELFEQALAQKRGVLIVTPHLGNWEFGAPMLIERGIPLLVLTQIEPSRGLTELRQASRARQGVETLVIGNDPFAVVEIIRRLEAGAVVALLVDRPTGNSATEVTLFGRPFRASLAAAELARASGCVLLPTVLLRARDGYAPEFYRPVEYHRAALREPKARQQLTQEIMRAFEPAIRQHPDQWYHFVPVWPKE